MSLVLAESEVSAGHLSGSLHGQWTCISEVQ